MDDENKFNYNQTGLEDRDINTSLSDENKVNLDEEFASEVVKEDDLLLEDDDFDVDEVNDPDLKNVYGWIGLALSVISFFIVPILFAAIGIVLGFVARRGDAPILGNTAIVVGVISILARLILLPLM